LPLGVHRASLPEVLDRFGKGSRQRMAVAERLERVYRLARDTGHLARFVVFGSFVTDQREPDDVDMFLVMDNRFDAVALRGEVALLFDHAAADVHFGASVFWIRQLAALGGEQPMIESWQTKRGGGQRGIVEIVEETP
jgi:predicted nucleotidyltransferase